MSPINFKLGKSIQSVIKAIYLVTWCFGVMRCQVNDRGGAYAGENIFVIHTFLSISKLLCWYIIPVHIFHYFWVKTIVVISNNDSDLYSYWSCTRRRHIFRPRVVEYPSSFLNTNILINFKVVMQVHHNSSHIWIYWVKTILLISSYDSDLYSYWEYGYTLIDCWFNRLQCLKYTEIYWVNAQTVGSIDHAVWTVALACYTFRCHGLSAPWSVGMPQIMHSAEAYISTTRGRISI